MTSTKFRAALAGVIAVFIAAASDGEVTSTEWLAIASAAASTFLVWLLPNKQKG